MIYGLRGLRGATSLALRAAPFEVIVWPSSDARPVRAVHARRRLGPRYSEHPCAVSGCSVKWHAGDGRAGICAQQLPVLPRLGRARLLPGVRRRERGGRGPGACDPGRAHAGGGGGLFAAGVERRADPGDGQRRHRDHVTLTSNSAGTFHPSPPARVAPLALWRASESPEASVGLSRRGPQPGSARALARRRQQRCAGCDRASPGGPPRAATHLPPERSALHSKGGHGRGT